MTQQTIADKQADIVREFQAISDWKARYRRIIQLGKELPELPDEYRDDKHKVKGCQSQVWLHAELEDGRVELQADSDAAIVKGLIAILLHVYSGATPQDIVESEPTFIDELGLSEHLSQTRANGLSAMIKQIKLYGVAFQAMASR